eukprot:Gregarina_sp_Poly_1__9028@NODE_550_length_7561_cov_218_532826_g435_i0_p4_GENE_NODE_550_length_7561_cov_218_532826_g435_i0NODE_550_length_7561_cov_218_532826_g435_i0_p4_ORF_typecomplete_len333_score33_66Abhydrolase_3/PF07859_13/2_5e09Hydrolase_4/PF12146_8/1_7e07DUF1057/PF06342_12/2_3e07COesterase/PF00135_28/0_0044Peptidase_S9/PF00326_21/0_005Alpha_GJ/PF03229_13/0_011Chlorophyllase2/PF12740_7/0_11Abhydrolase_2/PF02230_16/0_12Ndr/PF03096_14/0_19_NODE_550_length_7561_cov_218_532826_g435_i056646662
MIAVSSRASSTSTASTLSSTPSEPRIPASRTDQIEPEPKSRTKRICWTVVGGVLGAGVLGLFVANSLGAFDDYEAEINSDTVRLFQNPENINIPYTELLIPVADGVKLKGWHMRHTEQRPTFIYLQGGRLDLGWSLPQMARLFQDCNVNVIGLFYRDSAGINRQPDTVLTARSDIANAVEWILKNSDALDLDPANTFLFGEGIGCDLAVYAATENSQLVAGLLLENPRMTLPMQKFRLKHWDMLTQFAPSWLNDLLKHHYPNLYQNISTLKTPVCVFTDEKFSEQVAHHLWNSSKSADKWLVTPFSKSSSNNLGHPALIHRQWRSVSPTITF